MASGKDWIKRHFQQDASVLGTLLAFGLSSLALLVALTVDLDLENESLFALAVVMGPICFLPGPIVLIARLFRNRGREHARCEACGARPAAPARYLQVTGIVIIALLRELRLAVCPRCSHEAYVTTTGHTGLFGWWTPLTPLVVPWVILANTLAVLKHRLQVGGQRGTDRALDDERDYAVNLMRTKDTETVIEVLAQKTGMPAERVRAWLARLPERP